MKGQLSILHFLNNRNKAKIQLALGPCPGDKTARQVKCGPVLEKVPLANARICPRCGAIADSNE